MARVVGVLALVVASVFAFEAIAGAVAGRFQMLGMLLFSAVSVRYGVKKLRAPTRFMAEKK